MKKVSGIFRNRKIIIGLLLLLGAAVASCYVFFLWKGKASNKVQETLYADIDRDGETEKIELLWKRGRFGKHRPFWVKEDETELSQHIFIYDVLDGGELKPLWFASDIGREVVRMKVIGDGGDTLLLEDTEGNNTLWRWESFGLKNVDNEVRFVAFGDNIIHEEIIGYADTHEGGEYDFLYKSFENEIGEADIAAFGAETVLVDKDSAVSGYPCFGSPLEVGKALAIAGFDIAVCGNNHALDKGIYGIDVTTSFYEENGIKAVGVQNSRDEEYRSYELISRNGIRFALLSYTYGTNGMDASSKYPYAVHYLPRNTEEKMKVREDMNKAGEEADFVIVFAHWGEEYESYPNREQQEMAEFFAIAGADVVIGSHPHVVQGVDEIVKDGEKTVVFYSLGNFRAYQGMTEETRKGAEAVLLLEHSFDGVRLKSYELKDVDAFVNMTP